MKTTFLLLLFIGLFIRQGLTQLSFKIHSYEVDAILDESDRNQLYLKVAMDSAGNMQGPVILYQKSKENDTIVRMKSICRDNHLIDSLLIYSAEGLLMEEIKLTSVPKMNYVYFYVKGFSKLGFEGTKNGTSKKWATDLNDNYYLSSEHHYKNGVNEGIATYHDNGELYQLHECNEEGWNGIFMQYDSRGQLTIQGGYKSNFKDGLWKYFRDNGLISEMNYHQGELHGKAIEYWPNNNIKSVAFYQNGTPDSIKTTYYQRGALNERFVFLTGQQGIYEKWYETGEKEANGTLREDYTHEIHGKYISWYQNGKIKEKGAYENGEKKGEWISYHPNGTIKQHEMYTPFFPPVARHIEYDVSPRVFRKETPYNQYTQQSFTNNYDISDYKNLRFIRKYGTVKLRCDLQKDGTAHYQVITELKPKEAEQLLTFLHTSKLKYFRSFSIQEKSQPIRMNMSVSWVKQKK